MLRTIAVGRHVLLICDVRVEPGADLRGKRLHELEGGCLARVLALQAQGRQRFDWKPSRGYQLAPGDRIIVSPPGPG